ALGIVGGGGLAEPDGGGVGLGGQGEQAEQFGGAFDTEHQHAGGHRVECARVPDLLGAQQSPASGDDVVAGQPAVFVDDQQTAEPVRPEHRLVGGHQACTIAVRMRPSAICQRPSNEVSGTPPSVTWPGTSSSLRKVPEALSEESSTVKAMWASSKPSQRPVNGNHAL